MGAFALMLTQGLQPFLTARFVAGGIVTPGTGEASISFNGITGQMSTSQNFVSVAHPPEWAGAERVQGGQNPGRYYQARLDVLSGNAPNAAGGSAVGVFLNLSGTGLSWGLERTAVGGSAGVWRVTLLELGSNRTYEVDYNMSVTNT